MGKVIFILIFILSGVASFILLFKISNHRSLSIAGALFYTINPFMYERFLSGQWLVMLGFALTPLFLVCILNMFGKISQNRDTYLTLIFLGAIPFISMHHFFLWGMIFLIFSFISSIREINILRTFRIGQKNIIGILISCLWIIVIVNYSYTLQFSQKDLLYFASKPDINLGVIFNLISFNGMWNEGTNYTSILEINKIAIFFIIAILGITLFGLFCLITKKYYKEINFDNKLGIFIIGLLGLVLSIGSYGLVGYLYRFLFDVGLLEGMREAQKFLNLYVLSVSIFFVIGSKAIIEFTKKRLARSRWSEYNKKLLLRYLVVCRFLLTLCAFFPIFLGGLGQIDVSQYPQSYYEFNELLHKDFTANSVKSKILVLPWEDYGEFPFSKNRIANPAIKFFYADVFTRGEPKVLDDSTCDVEFNMTFEDSIEPYNACINYSDSPLLISKVIKNLEFDYILINKSFDFPHASDLLNSDGYERIIEDNAAIVYRVK